MSLGKFLVRTVLISICLWVAFFYLYGSFILYDNIVPCTGIDIDKWISEYYMSGIYSILAGFICSGLWYMVGDNYDGRSSLNVIYWLFGIFSLVGSVLVFFVVLLDSVEGAGASGFFTIVSAPLLYLLSSAWASPDMVKSVPPIHF